jgi:hypothetical protein
LQLAAWRPGGLSSTTEFVTNRQQTENNRDEAKRRISGAHSKLSTVSASKPKLKRRRQTQISSDQCASIHGTARLISVSCEPAEKQVVEAGQAPAFFVWRPRKMAGSGAG